MLAHPVHDITEIQQRQRYVRYFYDHEHTTAFRGLLRHVHDIPKMVSTILYKPLNPLIFVKLRTTLAVFLDQGTEGKLKAQLITALHYI